MNGTVPATTATTKPGPSPRPNPRRRGGGVPARVEAGVAGAPDAVLAAGPAAVTQFEIGELTAHRHQHGAGTGASQQ
jgi:hypothetical protein